MLEANQRNKQCIWRFWSALAGAAESELAALTDGAAAGDARWFGPTPIDELPSNSAYLRHDLLPLRRSFPNLRRQTHVFLAGVSNGKADGAENGRLWVGGTGLLKVCLHLAGTRQRLAYRPGGRSLAGRENRPPRVRHYAIRRSPMIANAQQSAMGVATARDGAIS